MSTEGTNLIYFHTIFTFQLDDWKAFFNSCGVIPPHWEEDPGEGGYSYRGLEIAGLAAAITLPSVNAMNMLHSLGLNDSCDKVII
jgi:hypothetical protein